MTEIEKLVERIVNDTIVDIDVFPGDNPPDSFEGMAKMINNVLDSKDIEDITNTPL